MKSPSQKLPLPSMKKQRSASPSQAIPRSAPLDLTRSMIIRRFSSSSGFGSWSGNSPFGDEVHLLQLQRQPLEDRADHRTAHPVAAVDDDLHRLDVVGVDEGERVGVEFVPDVDLLGRAAAGRLAEAGFDLRLDVADAGVAGERQRPLADELHAGVGLGVVRGGDHRAAVELARADQVVEHLGRDLAGVEDRRALGDEAVAHRARHRRRRQPHVAPEADPQLARLLAAQPSQHPGEGPPDRLSAVVSSISRAVQAADVVGLEDPGGGEGGLVAQNAPFRAS